MTGILSVTVDIEDWYHVPAVCGSSFSKFKDTESFFSEWTGRYDYLTEPTMKTLNLLKEFGIKATFFIVAEVVNRYPGLVQLISREGHEIACHGYDHRCYIDSRTQRPIHSREFFKDRMRLAKEILETETNQEVVGFRAPAAYITGWMIDIVESLGFRYDSSVSANSLYNKTDSTLAGVTRIPYYPSKGELTKGNKRELLEIPFPYFQLGPLRIPCSGGPFLRFFGSRFILSGLNQTLQKSPTFLYFHPLDISHRKFPQGFSKNRPLYWSIKGKIIEDRIRWILSNIDAKFVTMMTINRWITDNETAYT